MKENNKSNPKKILSFSLAVLLIVLVFMGVYFVYNRLSKSNDLNLEVGQTLQTFETIDISKNEGSKSEQNNEIDYSAPDITATDADGNPISLKDFRGKTVILNFWASWCPPCKAEFPDFQKYYDEKKEAEDIAFVLINLVGSNGETKEKAAAFLEENTYSLPLYLDVEGRSASAYQIVSIPTTYIITPSGELYYRNVGMISYDKLLEMTKKAAEE